MTPAAWLIIGGVAAGGVGLYVLTRDDGTGWVSDEDIGPVLPRMRPPSTDVLEAIGVGAPASPVVTPAPQPLRTFASRLRDLQFKDRPPSSPPASIPKPPPGAYLVGGK